jgi:FkbM family methyltransferase
VKILPNGIAVIDGDTHISRWVEQHGTLEIAKAMLEPFRRYVPLGSWVVDAGANIGDHTITYAEWVGIDGAVFAFEPNPEAFECLVENTRHLEQVIRANVGLSDRSGSCDIHRLENVGASHLSGSEGSIKLRDLDSFEIPQGRLSFIKIDVEGFETRVLRGAVKTIEDQNPVMLIEVNAGALVRAGTSSNELLGLIDRMGYNVKITDPRLIFSDPQFDVICIPKVP